VSGRRTARRDVEAPVVPLPSGASGSCTVTTPAYRSSGPSAPMIASDRDALTAASPGASAHPASVMLSTTTSVLLALLCSVLCRSVPAPHATPPRRVNRASSRTSDGVKGCTRRAPKPSRSMSSRGGSARSTTSTRGLVRSRRSSFRPLGARRGAPVRPRRRRAAGTRRARSTPRRRSRRTRARC
jgi:hypothetical protein